MARRLVAPERRPNQIITSPVVCVQCIETTWTKQSRGGPGAVLRNQVPEALVLSGEDLKRNNRCLVHRVQYDERNDFAAPVRVSVGNTVAPPVDLGCLRLTVGDGMIVISYRYEYSQGAPERHSARLPALDLQAGQWGRVKYNGRLVDHDKGTWWYEQHVFNIGLFAMVKPNIFLDTEPVKVFSQMAHLW